MAKVGFHKGSLGSPFQLEYQADEGMDLGTAVRGEGAPRIGAGVLGRRVTMEVQRAGRNSVGKRKSDSEE